MAAGVCRLLSDLMEAASLSTTHWHSCPMQCRHLVMGYGIYATWPCIMPAFLNALICRLPTLPPQGVWDGSVTLDLTENRLGQVADWQPLVTALKLRSWLRVRLGSEVMPPRVIDALIAADMRDLWDSQLFVDRPWENPCNRQLGDAITAMSALVMEMRAASVHSASQATAAAASSKQSASACKLAAEESDTNNRGVSNAWEQQAAAGIAAHLQDGEVVVVNYKWRHKVDGKAGDLDYLVTGTLKDVGPVIVIGEAKLNMPSRVVEALTQVDQNLSRWAELVLMYGCSVDDDAQPLQDNDRMDIHKLRVADLGNRQACVALSGASIPDFTMQRIVEHMNRRNQGTPWFTVSMPSGEAKLHCP